MYFVFDPSNDDQVAIGRVVNTKLVQQFFPWSVEGGLLEALEKTLKDMRKELADLRGIAVVVGKGRFTATRIAVTVANTLSYALGIPVAAISSVSEEDVRSIIVSHPTGQLIHASYSGEARIGKKSKKQ